MTLEQVEIKRTIPKGQGQSKDFKTKKIFVRGIPYTVTEGREFLNLISLVSLNFGRVEFCCGESLSEVCLFSGFYSLLVTLLNCQMS